MESDEAEHEGDEDDHAHEGEEDDHAHETEEAEDEHTHSPDAHTSGEAHDVPADAADVPNPFEATDDSVKAGSELFAASCAICHGETGEGDGPGAEGLETQPADLHEDHVQALSDGALFYIISHGSPETPMPAWENVLSEEQRWHVVNYMRALVE